MSVEELIARAGRLRPVPGWLDPGPRLFGPPLERSAWVTGIRDRLATLPGLRAELERAATARVVQAAPSGWTEPGGLTHHLPALALLALLDQDPTPLVAANEAVDRVLALDDWVPPHHAHSRPLDLSAAGVVGDLALYLDLARELLSPDARRALATALQTRGIAPFSAMCQSRQAFWTTARHNWATVIAGNIALALLSIWEAVPDPGVALAHVTERLAGPISSYPADGSYEEGPGYWHYGLGECLPALRALQLVSGGALDLFTLPFVANTGAYALAVRTPDGGCFEVEDASRRWAAGWMLGVLGLGLDRPGYRTAARATAGTAAGGTALWQALFCGGASEEAAAAPAMAFFPGTQNAMLRSGPEPSAFFAGLHAGSNVVNHAHLDLGTFTVVAAGQRLLADAGSWSYTLDYFDRRPGGRRWDYAPNTTAGHNALLVDGLGQLADDAATCGFSQADMDPGAGLALFSVDLTAAYRDRLSKYRRHFAYLAEGLLLVIDEIAAAAPHRLAWCAHPTAVAAPLPDGATGWSWQVAGAMATLRLLGLDGAAGHTLSEATGRTTYADRVGTPRSYVTTAVRAEPLHPLTAWTVVAEITGGPAGGASPGRADLVGPAEIVLETAQRRGRLTWGDGVLAFAEA